MSWNTQNQFSRSSSRHILRVNSLVIASLTIFTTACAAYLLTVIANTINSRSLANRSFTLIPEQVVRNFPASFHAIPSKNLTKLHNVTANSTTENSPTQSFVSSRFKQKRSLRTNAGLILPKEWQPLIQASETTITKVRPTEEYLINSLMEFKQRLANMSPPELTKLLDYLQKRVNRPMRAIMPSQSSSKASIEDQGEALVPMAVVPAGRQAGELKMNTLQNYTVIRSKKLSRLMNYLDTIEAMNPSLNEDKLRRMSIPDDNQTILHVLKPEVMKTILMDGSAGAKTNGSIFQKRPPRGIENILELQADSVEPTSSPESDWLQSEVVEDWPSTEAPTAQPQLKKKKKRKKKKKIIKTTTTTTTTQIPYTETLIPSTPAPPTSFEEVWIEEEEDIVRPPKRKLKKYKKKTNPQEATSTTPVPTTTTTTTYAPTTTTVEPTTIEDWPEEQVVTTKAPWPNKHQQEEQWPEEAWLEDLKSDIQGRVHIMYV